MALRKNAIGAAGALLAGALLLIGCLGPADATRTEDGQRFDSPQGDRTAVVTVNQSQDDPTLYLTLLFEVREKRSDRVLHRQQTTASSRSSWTLDWPDNDTVRLHSSDVGTYCWGAPADGSWRPVTCP